MKVRCQFPLHDSILTRFHLVFIAEITARAFIIADSNKRRTLSRADIAKAISKSDQFDFLIDIIPRDEPLGSTSAGVPAPVKGQVKKTGIMSDKPDSVCIKYPHGFRPHIHP